jgi:RNA polymerase sigma-70 factor (ECF subfamily)
VSAAAISPQRAFEIGRSTYPAIDLTPAAFVSFAAARAETWGGDPERAADLYLACACVEGLPAGIAEFLARFAGRIPLFLGRFASQTIVTRCLVGNDANPPALVSYSATGSLEGWLRVTAVREALMLQRRAERDTHEVEAVLESRSEWMDREISLIKEIYREPVSRAFAWACAELDGEERVLLRLHYVEGVTTAHLAKIYGISRATLIRRLASARETLLTRVKAALKRSVGVADQDFDSLLQLVKSQIDLRLSVVLQESTPQNP